MSARRRTRLVLLGPPGAGKGTQAAAIKDGLGVPHVSTGDMLREAVARGTEIGRQAKAVMDAGKLVSDAIVIGIAKERLSQPDAEKGFILDGFPRTIAQAEALDALLGDLGMPLDACLAITADTEAIVARLLKRAEIEGRADDNEATIRARMKEYDAKTAPLLAYYRERGLLAEVDGMGEVAAVTSRIMEVIG
ncbi:MAG: adenylate kinase [Myxococcota bacterium]|nr:adenylate kinase [Myxococcales bacterium]